MDPVRIGNLIKELRIKSNLTQNEFANKYGVTYQAVSKWENGKNIPDISVLKLICEDYNISLDSILDGMKVSNLYIAQIKQKHGCGQTALEALPLLFPQRIPY